MPRYKTKYFFQIEIKYFPNPVSSCLEDWTTCWYISVMPQLALDGCYRMVQWKYIQSLRIIYLIWLKDNTTLKQIHILRKSKPKYSILSKISEIYVQNIHFLDVYCFWRQTKNEAFSVQVTIFKNFFMVFKYVCQMHVYIPSNC